MALLNQLNPDRPEEGRKYLRSLLEDQANKSNWTWASVAGVAAIGWIEYQNESKVLILSD